VDEGPRGAAAADAGCAIREASGEARQASRREGHDPPREGEREAALIPYPAWMAKKKARPAAAKAPPKARTASSRTSTAPSTKKTSSATRPVSTKSPKSKSSAGRTSATRPTTPPKGPKPSGPTRMPMGGSPRVDIPAKPGPVGLVVRDPSNPEVNRILDDRDHVAPWRLWGPYVTERQWGTVREDYSADGNAWDYLPHDHARSRAYRWGEDGIAGVSDFEQRLCLSLSLWNGRDPILKERFFGLTNNEGNHGEDIKELHWYLDATPSMSYLKMLYKYPQAEYPYAALVRENRARGRHEPEYELLDTGVLDDGRYFDVVVEYAKAGPEDLLMLVEAFNRGPDPADLWIVPQLFFRNTWNWEQNPLQPRLALTSAGTIVADHHTLGEYTLASDGRPQIVLCENETNVERLYGQPRDGRVFKDGVNVFVVGGRADAVRLEGSGTKAGIIHRATIPPGGSMRVKLRLAARIPRQPMSDFDAILDARCRESDRFYEFFADRVPDDDHRLVQRQAFAGLIWTRQYFNYDVRLWLDGDPTQPPPPASRLQGRNRRWRNFSTEYVLSIPDKWEYPWFASWDLSFHCVAFAGIDPEFAKKQIKRLLHDRAMHSSGEIPAYE